MDELQAKIGKWAVETFPNATPTTIVTHLLREVVELGLAVGMTEHDISRALLSAKYKSKTPSKASEEAADCLGPLCHLAYRLEFSLFDEALEKHEINLTRKWGKPDTLGVVEHIREES